MYRELCATDLFGVFGVFGVFGFGAFRPRWGQFLWTERMKRLCSFAHQTVLVNVRLPKFTRTTKRRTIVIHVASSGEPWTYKVHWNWTFFQISAQSYVL